MKTIELTDGERQAVLHLLDLAVKNPQGGLKVAGAANYLASKFVDENPPEEAPQEAPQDEGVTVEEVEE